MDLIKINGREVKPLWMANARSTVYVVETTPDMPNERGDKNEITEKRTGKFATVSEWRVGNVGVADDDTSVVLTPKEDGIGKLTLPADYINEDHAIQTGVFLDGELARDVENLLNAQFNEEDQEELDKLAEKIEMINKSIAKRNDRIKMNEIARSES